MTDNEIRNQMDDIDEIVHQKTRLAILALLSGGDEIEFTGLRKRLGLTDGNLGRHLATLSQAGLVSISRNYSGRRVRSWAHLTSQGYVSLDLELRTLQSIIDTVRHSRRITADPPPRDMET